LQQQREQCLMSKQWRDGQGRADRVNLGELGNLHPPKALRSRNFIVNWASLALKDLGTDATASSAPAESEPAIKADYAQFAGVSEFHEYLANLPANSHGGWLNLERGRESRIRDAQSLPSRFRQTPGKGAPSGRRKGRR